MPVSVEAHRPASGQRFCCALCPTAAAVLLDDPDQVVRGDRVLHLHYTVQR
jgi:hypothetical protein